MRALGWPEIVIGDPVSTGAWLCSPPMDYPLEWPPARDVIIELEEA